MTDNSNEIKDSSGKPVKSILKKRIPTFTEEPIDADSGGSGIQWDEMNILMTNHPPDKDYGHMKIEEPKTPYHEYVDDEDEPNSNIISPDDLASRVQEAAADVGTRPNKWEQSNDSEEEPESEETKQHKEEFRQWRKKHYNEFHAVQRARELIAKDLAEAEADESSQSTSHDTSMQSVEDDSTSEDMQHDSTS